MASLMSAIFTPSHRYFGPTLSGNTPSMGSSTTSTRQRATIWPSWLRAMWISWSKSPAREHPSVLNLAGHLSPAKGLLPVRFEGLLDILEFKALGIELVAEVLDMVVHPLNEAE